jgi:ABC-2 type transport system ATP-binding protein
VDATIRSGQVRAVTDTEGAQSVIEAIPEQWNVGLNNAAPTFEDAFMSIIPRDGTFHDEAVPSRQAMMVSKPGGGEDAGETEVVVKTKDLQKFFGDFEAVKGLSLEVRQGEIFGLLGPNGAGKSTTFRMMCGLLKVSAGEISVAGRDLRRSGSLARSRLGYMAQQFSLYSQLTVLENLRFFGTAYGLGANRLRRRVAWAFSEFSLEAWRDTAAGALPGGYKQRLAMAAALLHEPDILFLDEPTSGVDPFARREFWLRINAFAEQGITVVVTTHFMEESEYCDRILIMSQGNTLAMGTPAEIRALGRSKQNPNPTMEDAFIALAEGNVAASGSVSTGGRVGDRDGGSP